MSKEQSSAKVIPFPFFSLTEEDRGSEIQKDFYFASTKMETIAKLALKAAKKKATILLRGETGTGKGLFAKYIYSHSLRNNKAFIDTLICEIPEKLIESRLFGHLKGSYTGATETRMGLLEAAAGGTIFLDEIGDLPIAIQVKLFRFLQERRITRIGENASRTVDVRVITATNRNLEQMISQGLFREDLYYRLSEIELTIPSLRERPEDIIFLANHLLKEKCIEHEEPEKVFSQCAMDMMLEYSWPGNVRELENVTSRMALWGEETITADDIRSFFPMFNPDHLIAPPTVIQPEDVPELSSKTKQLLDIVMGSYSKREAADKLGIPTRVLTVKLRMLGIAPPWENALPKRLSPEKPLNLSALDDEERKVRQALAETFTIKDAAGMLGISPSTFRRRMRCYNIPLLADQIDLGKDEKGAIEEALGMFKSQKDAASYLGISEQYLGFKMKKFGIPTSRQKRPPEKASPVLSPVEALSSETQSPSTEKPADASLNIALLPDAEQKATLIKLLTENNWNQKRVAKILDIPLKSKTKGLRGLIVKHQIIKVAPKGIWFGRDYKE